MNLDYFHGSVSYGGNFKYLRSVVSINVITGRVTTRISNAYGSQTREAVATVTNNVTVQAIKGTKVIFNIRCKDSFKNRCSRSGENFSCRS